MRFEGGVVYAGPGPEPVNLASLRLMVARQCGSAAAVAGLPSGDRDRLAAVARAYSAAARCPCASRGSECADCRSALDALPPAPLSPAGAAVLTGAGR